MICTDVFEATARFQAKALGLPEARIVIVPHPFSGVDSAEVKKKAESAFAILVAKLLDSRGRSRDAAV